MKKHQLFTIGYSGHDTESFLARLKEFGVAVVVDVRRIPMSRKPGFSRKRLSEFLSEAGIEYVPMGDLGVPKDLLGRMRSREIELSDYLSQFERYLETQGPALDQLRALALHAPCCLLCLEHAPEECHRSVVAAAASRRKGRPFEIVHL